MPDHAKPTAEDGEQEQKEMTAVATFTCTICGETSTEICVYCTKDTCDNHLCQRCLRCSDCCVCESPLIREEAAQAEPVEGAALGEEETMHAEPDDALADDSLEEEDEEDEDDEDSDDEDDELEEEEELEEAGP